jgi:uncharacterized protein (TIGR00369 family)
MAELHRLDSIEPAFGFRAAGRLMTEMIEPWLQELGLLVEGVETSRPAGAPPDWQPGALLRLPFSRKACREGAFMCGPALMALADTAMLLACSAACNGYRAMSPIDQTMHFVRPANFDVIADARVVRIGRTTSFGRVILFGAADRQPVGMASSAYAML